jgi:serine/threonine-protein kinase HipA
MTSGRVSTRRHGLQALEVRLGQTVIGTIVHLGNDDIVFAFDKTYAADDPTSRSTLSLSFKATGGGLVEHTRPTHVRLPPFFSNLLPEAHLREYLAARGGVHPDREFLLLWLLGADLPGAVEVRAIDGAAMPPIDDAVERQKGRKTPLRFSLAGVQLKFSALRDASGGLTIPVSGVGGDWIVKLPSPRFENVPENEFAMMTLARAVGIDVPDVQLIATDDIGGLPPRLPEAFRQSLAVRRYDRPRAGVRRHAEDFAQVFGVYPEQKYQRASYGSIGRVLWLETGAEGVAEVTRRLAFNALIGNADAHLKNWSVIYPDGHTPRLAPAYDLVSTVAYLPEDRLALSLGETKDFRRIDLERFRRFADKAELPARLVVESARETAARVRALLPTHEPLRSMGKAFRATLAAHAKSVPL